MEPGTLLSLQDDTWLQPLPEDPAAVAAPHEYVVLLVEDYVAFADGEIARLSSPSDGLELFDGLVLVPPEALDERPPKGRQRQLWAQAIYWGYIAEKVRQLRNPTRSVESPQPPDSPLRRRNSQ